MLLKYFYPLFFILSIFCESNAVAKVGSVTGLPIPRFVIIKSRDVNLRSGPGITYPAKLNYKCLFTPLLIKSEFDNWRLVQDIYNNEGWIHEAMIDGRKYVQVKREKALDRSDAEVIAYRLPDVRSQAVAKVQANAIIKLIKCKDIWCKVSLSSKNTAWIQKDKLWGIVESQT